MRLSDPGAVEAIADNLRLLLRLLVHLLRPWLSGLEAAIWEIGHRGSVVSTIF